MPERPPLFLAGPTAVGKSSVALVLARRLGGEIISVDSMQVYRGLDIGTAKPTPAERAEIPHHLIDVADLTQVFHAAEFVAQARAALRSIQARGRVPIFCGGTGLYFKAYLHGLARAPSADEDLRAQLYQMPLADLLEELRGADPAAYERIDPNNRRRLVRAVEVIRLTGRPFSAQQAPWTQELPSEAKPRIFALERDKEDLRKRIEARVEGMFRRGLVDEVRHLLELGLKENKTAMQALGYRQIAENLLGGSCPEDTLPRVKVKTWQFAKRQLTWFRHQMDVEWIRVGPDEPEESAAKQLMDKYLQVSGAPSSGLRGL